MLAPALFFDDRESLLSYVARLARFHAGASVVPFLRDIGIKPERLASGEPDALARLAVISGTPEAALRRNGPVRVGTRLYDLRGELVAAEFLSRPDIVFCPACLQKDDRTGMRYGRWIWALSVVRTCPDHGIPLLHQAKASWDHSLHYLDRIVPERGDELVSLVEGSERRSASPLQEYAIARLEQRNGPSWLDAQTLEQAVRATELLGVLIAFGPDQKLPELTQDDWDYAGRVGYEFTARGEEGIREALEAQFRKFDLAAGAPGVRKIFGSFYNSLAHSKSLKDPGDIKRILREFIFDRIAYATGETILGAQLPERRLHTVASLALEEGLDPRTLRSVLVAADAIPEGAPSHHAILAKKGSEIAARVKRVVHVISLPDALNCARPIVDQLFAERLLTPIYYGRPGTRGRTQKAVDRREIAELVGKLHAVAAPVDMIEERLVSIPKAAEKAKIPGVGIVHLILGGFLQHVVRVAGEDGIGALRVDPDEVKANRSAVTIGLSVMEASAKLKIPAVTGWQLVDRYPAEVSLEAHRVVGPDSQHAVVRLDPVLVQAFAKEFTTPARLAEQNGLQIGKVVGRLRERGVRTVLPGNEVGIDFYRINDLPEDLFL